MPTKQLKTVTHHFKTSLKDIKKVTQDVREHHHSQLEKLSIEMTELRKELDD